MTTTEDAQHPTEEALRRWNWHADLIRQERTIPWLARQVGGVGYRAIYRYADGTSTAPLDWLRGAARVLGGPS